MNKIIRLVYNKHYFIIFIVNIKMITVTDSSKLNRPYELFEYRVYG